MRALSFFAVLVGFTFSQASFAQEADVWCRVDGYATSATTETGHYHCAEAFAQGSACYTGSRVHVIRMINSGFFNWDEEWLERGHRVGPSGIGYTWVDGPNSIRQKILLRACPPQFFR